MLENREKEKIKRNFTYSRPNKIPQKEQKGRLFNIGINKDLKKAVGIDFYRKDRSCRFQRKMV